MSKKGSSKGKQSAYQRYKNENRCVKNKTKKIQKHIKEHPNDEVAKHSLKSVSYSRKTPKSRLWRGDGIKEYARMLRFVGRNGNEALHRKSYINTQPAE